MKIFDRIRQRLRGDTDAVTLCRALAPEDWRHLHTADAAGRGVVLVATGEADLAREIARLWLDVAIEVDADTRDAPGALAKGQRVLIVADGWPQAVSRAAHLGRQTGASIVPVTIARDGDRVAVRVGAPIRDVEDESPDLEIRIERALAG